MFPFVYREKAPNTHLRSYIRRYWRFRRRFGPGKSQTIFPDGNYELMWVHEGTLLADGEPVPQFFVGGQTNGPVKISAPGVVEVWCVRFLPWGLVPFGDASQAASTRTTAEKIFTEATYRELYQLFQTATRKTIFQNLDNYFLQKLLASRINDAHMQAATAQMLAQNGAIKVKELADRCRLSQRQLERIIAKSTGRTPHDIAARIRFEQVRNTLARSPATPLAALAQQYGYADQSHLHKEFRRYTNLTPMQYAEEFAATYGHLYPAAGQDPDKTIA